MSSIPEHLSPGLFVVRPLAAEAKANGLARLEGKASVKPLGGRTPGWVVKLNKLPKNARAGWNSLHRLLGDGYAVLPAIVDEAGQYRYPTGLLSLRFEGDATEQALQTLADTYGLEFVSRPKYTRQQALFRPADGSDVFLPDVSGKIGHDAKVEAVWFDAESAYSRS
ncbi:MAG: hypothetical protein V4673_16060 [Pseudomonadota bacterium]